MFAQGRKPRIDIKLFLRILCCNLHRWPSSMFCGTGSRCWVLFLQAIGLTFVGCVLTSSPPGPSHLPYSEWVHSVTWLHYGCWTDSVMSQTLTLYIGCRIYRIGKDRNKVLQASSAIPALWLFRRDLQVKQIILSLYSPSATFTGP